MNQVWVLRDDLLLVTVERISDMDGLQRYVEEPAFKKLGVRVLVFGQIDTLTDLRDAPPEITEAAEMVSAFLRERAS